MNNENKIKSLVTVAQTKKYKGII